MEVKVGLSSTDLSTLDHKSALVSSESSFEIQKLTSASHQALARVLPGQKLKAELAKGSLTLSVTQSGKAIKTFEGESFLIKPLVKKERLILESVKRQGAKGSHFPSYTGELIIFHHNRKIRVSLNTGLETYLNGVLDSEIPASYHLEAIKAQALAARTYALNPRVDHTNDKINVCDSYLCCQYFAGHKIAQGRHRQAIEETKGEIIVYREKPILALFSSNAGGHTENYENCFSDPLTNAFPPEPVPYLKGVAEGPLPQSFSKDSGHGIKDLWQAKDAKTADAWSPHFRWHVVISGQALEAHMHHVIDEMMKTKDVAPFISAPSSGKFGHIDRFEIVERGVSGTAIALLVHTSSGVWKVKKELVIRSAFRNPEAKVTRLKSARLFFVHERDRLGLLSRLVIRGLGWGHGVGLQQTGAQGFALKGRSYRQIINHYFTGVEIART